MTIKNLKIKRWGNGSGILLPKVLLDMFSLKPDDSFSVVVENDQIVLSPVKRKHLTLAERFANYSCSAEPQGEFWTDDPVGKEQF